MRSALSLKKRNTLFILFFTGIFFFVPQFINAELEDANHVRVFPSTVSGNWSNLDAIKTFDAQGSLGDSRFTKENSASPNSVVFTEQESSFFKLHTNEKKAEVIRAAPSEPVSTPVLKSVPVSVPEPTPTPEPVPIPEPAPVPVPEPVTAPTPPPDSTSTPQPQAFLFLKEIQSFLLSFVSLPARAQQTDVVPPPSPDVVSGSSTTPPDQSIVQPEPTPPDQTNPSVPAAVTPTDNSSTPSVEPPQTTTPEVTPPVTATSIPVQETMPKNVHTESPFIAEGFSLNDNKQNIKSAKLAVSFSHEVSDHGELTFEYSKDDHWIKLHQTLLTLDSTNEEGTLLYLPLDWIKTAADLRGLKVRATYKDAVLDHPPVLVDALWVDLELEPVQVTETTPSVAFVSKQKDFQGDEDVELRFRFLDNEKKQKKTWMNQLAQLAGSEELDLSKNTQVTTIDPDGIEITSLQLTISYENNTDIVVSIPENEQMKKPGVYKMSLKIFDRDVVHAFTQDFSIGVIAVNLDKDVYQVNDSVYLQIGVLDKNGETLCGANLDVMVIDPNGNRSNVDIQHSSTCGPKSVTDVPDYFGFYFPSVVGHYEIQITNNDTGMKVSEWFTVANETPAFVIQRVGATRIYPLSQYQMTVSYISTNDFTGSVSDTVPTGFVVTNATFGQMSGAHTNATLVNSAGGTEVKADAVMQKGISYTLTYTYDAPDVTPYLFLLGPANVQSTDQTYVEERRWQLASDAFDVIEPNGDSTIGCTPTPTGTHFSTLDDHISQPTAGDIQDFITCTTTQSDSFSMTSISNVGTVSSIDAWAYYENKVNEAFQVELWNVNETVQYGTTQELQSDQGVVWHSVTFSGLSLTQAQLDDLKMKVIDISTTNSSNGTSSVIYSLYAGVTYVLDNQPPVVSVVHINGDQSIVLSPSVTTPVIVTGSVSDNKGYADITTVSMKLYRSGTTSAENCSLDADNCYTETSACTLSNCASNSCDVSCTADIDFYADPTDVGTPWADESWAAWMVAHDTLSQIGSAYAAAPEDVLTTSAISINTGSLAFGTLMPGSVSEQQNQNVVVTSEGNAKLRLSLEGSGFINQANQQVAAPASNQHFSIGTDKTFADSTALSSTSGVNSGAVFAKKTSGTSKASQTIWFSLLTPNIRSGAYENIITFLTQAESLPW